MKLPHLVIAAVVLATTTSLATADSAKSCPTQESRPIHFRSKTSPDVLTIAVSGGPCLNAKLALSIYTVTGHQIYRTVMDLQHQEFFGWEEPGLKAEVAAFVRKLLVDVSTPVNEPPVFGSPANGEELQFVVPQEKYEQVMRSGQLVFHHQTYYEGGRYVAYDPVAKRAVVLVEWGL